MMSMDPQVVCGMDMVCSKCEMSRSVHTMVFLKYVFAGMTKCTRHM
jgi:hypothetical protein